MAEEGEKKESGWLSKVFWGAAKLVTVGIAAAVAWQIFLDPLFFPPFHDLSNTIAQSWIAKVNSWFGWIPKHVGLTKEEGLLSGFMKWFLADEIEKRKPVEEETVSRSLNSKSPPQTQNPVQAPAKNPDIIEMESSTFDSATTTSTFNNLNETATQTVANIDPSSIVDTGTDFASSFLTPAMGF